MNEHAQRLGRRDVPSSEKTPPFFVERVLPVDGLSTQNEIFAIRLLELARYLSPRGNRVRFVEWCEESRIRAFLECFPEVWQRITDNPPREGIRPSHEYSAGRSAYALQAAAFQELIQSQLGGYRHLWLGGLSLSQRLYEDITRREFEDLHLLIGPEDFSAVVEILEELGFKESSERLSRGQEAARLRWGYQSKFRHDSGFQLNLQWRLFSHWVGSELVSFEELWSRSCVLTWEGLSPWRTLGNADTLVYLGLRAFEQGWGRLQYLLDLAQALDRLDYTWDQVLLIAGPRRVLMERATELVVRLMGVPHPQTMTYHYGDYEHALDVWSKLAAERKPPGPELLGPELWSCDPSQALKLRLSALLTPEMEDIRKLSLPPPLIFLYPLLRLLRLLLKPR